MSDDKAGCKIEFALYTRDTFPKFITSTTNQKKKKKETVSGVGIYLRDSSKFTCLSVGSELLGYFGAAAVALIYVARYDSGVSQQIPRLAKFGLLDLNSACGTCATLPVWNII